MNKLKICFYFPYFEDSGVPVLFSRLANSIAAKYKDIDVYIIDYENGSMSKNVNKIENIHLIKFIEGKIVVPPNDCTIVFQSLLPYYWPKELVLNSTHKIYFWNLHPKNLIPSLLPLPIIRDIPLHSFIIHKFLSIFYPRIMTNMKNFVKLLLDNNALAFMDQTNYNFTCNYLFLDKFKPTYLPVPALESNVLKENYFKNNHLNFCWVGRLCDFKVNILILTINKLSEVLNELKINVKFFIVGDGPMRNFVEKNVKETSFLKIKFIGALPHKELDSFMLKNVDVLAAMGTSALEGAKLKIPTLLLDASYKRVDNDYRFRFLYNAECYDLAHFISESDIESNNSSLKDIVFSIYENYECHAEKSYNYFLTNHSLSEIAKKFIKHINESTLRYDLIKKTYFRKPAMLRLYNFIRGNVS